MHPTRIRTDCDFVEWNLGSEDGIEKFIAKALNDSAKFVIKEMLENKDVLDIDIDQHGYIRIDFDINDSDSTDIKFGIDELVEDALTNMSYLEEYECYMAPLKIKLDACLKSMEAKHKMLTAKEKNKS